MERLTGAGVPIVEDGAQCHGASRFGRASGSWGVAATSFYPSKNLGAYGDAGAVLAVDDDLADRVRALRNHGGSARHRHEHLGYNSRLDALQAVVLRAKLTRLTEANRRRQLAAARYDALLERLDVVRPTVLEDNVHVWHLYVVRIPGAGGPDRRDAVLKRLRAAGVGAGIHYPVPIHRVPAFTHLGYRAGSMPNAESAAAEILSLPLYPQITEAHQEFVASTLAEALRGC
jgi:dTDP-4-amino-4,6-dideoxygalactose transaminase